MKRCPQCNRVETDEALKFCRIDGATLVSESVQLPSETGTVQLGYGPVSTEVETSILPHATDVNVNRTTAATTVLPPQLGATTGELKRKARKRNLLIGVTAFLILAAGAALLSSFFLWRRSGATIQSIAVMPFINEGGNADVEYLSDGMTETLD